MDSYNAAKNAYTKYGIDVEDALEQLDRVSISIPCWQGDDVRGLDQSDSQLSGGIQTTGNYPGRARNAYELMDDATLAFTLIGGKKRLNLHASYALKGDDSVDRNRYEGRHFDAWIEFAKNNGIGLDFNPTFFAHPMVKDNLTLTSPLEEVREFWIEHGIASRRIANYIGECLQDQVLNNIWIPDGMKDYPGNRLAMRSRLRESLDMILEEDMPYVIDSVESKVFGIGLESYTAGSSEFYLSYAMSHPSVYYLMDAGHYHPTESVADKISTLLLFFDKLPLHLSRPMRWDSDHVVSFNDPMREIAQELVRCQALDKCLIGLDFFDASINRIAAWVIGARNVQKSIMYALLQNTTELLELQEKADFTNLLMVQEEYKTLPFGAVWNEWCERQGVPLDGEWYATIKQYEEDVLSRRQ